MASKLNPDPNTGAKLHGQQVVYPGPFDVFVDIDTELLPHVDRAAAMFNEAVEKAEQRGPVKIRRLSPIGKEE
mgnify:CR=1 FL=1